MRVWAIDPDGVRRGMVEVTACEAVLRDCGVGSWLIESVDPLAWSMSDGWRVAIPGRDGILISGPVTEFAVRPVDGVLARTVTGVSELVALDDRLVYPDPAVTATGQSTAYSYKASGPAGEVVARMVDVNAGRAALPERRTKHFAVAPAAGTGTNVSVDTRWGRLLEEARRAARAGGVAFDAVWEPGGAVLRHRARRDLSRQVRFDTVNGGLTSGDYSLSAPTVTVAVVAGQGEGTARTIRTVETPPAWGRRIEVFKDQRDTDELDELDKSGAEVLAEGVASASAKFETIEVHGCVLGTDFQVGDTVTVRMGAVTVSEPVREAHLTWDGHGRVVTLTLGDHQQDDDQNPTWVQHVRALDARLTPMERV